MYPCLLILAFLAAPETPATRPAQDLDYAAWAEFAPGSRVTYHVTTTLSAPGRAQVNKDEVALELKEVNPREVVLERTTRSLDPPAAERLPVVQTQHYAAQPARSPATTQVAPEAEGEEELTIGGQVLATRWERSQVMQANSTAVRTTWTALGEQSVELAGRKLPARFTQTRLQAGPMTETVATWRSERVPGGMVRRTVTHEGGQIQRTEETVAVSFQDAATVAAELKSLEEELQGRWEQHRSITAHFKSVNLERPEEASLQVHGEGTYELLKSDGQVLLRLEVTSRVPALNQTARMLQIIDGAHSYVLEDEQGERRARKTNIDPRDTGAPRPTLERHRAFFDLRLLPATDVDSPSATGKPAGVPDAPETQPGAAPPPTTRPAAGDPNAAERPAGGAAAQLVAVEAVPKDRAPGERTRMVLTFDRPSGFLVKLERYGMEGRLVSTSSFSDVKFDVPLSRERFVFEPPAGVEVVDQTAKP